MEGWLMKKEKLAEIKNKIKKHTPEIMDVLTATSIVVASAAIIAYTKKKTVTVHRVGYLLLVVDK